MRFALLALFAIALGSLCAPQARCSSQPVTVLLQFDHPESKVSSRIMEREVRSLLGKSIDLRFKAFEEESGSEPGRLVIFRMHGFCSMLGPETMDNGGVVLGSTYVSDGTILPFGRVECDRLRSSVQRVFGIRNPQQHESQLGLAMGRVMAHELYHMLAGSKDHTQRGVTKAALTPFELIGGHAVLPTTASSAMETHPPLAIANAEER